MSDQTPDQRLTALETALGTLETLLEDLATDLEALKQAQTTFQTALQATLGPLIRQIQGENGLAARQTASEAALHAHNARLEDLESFDTQQKRGPSTTDLANELADLRLTLQRLQTADKYALTREKLGRLMVAHNLISDEELQE